MTEPKGQILNQSVFYSLGTLLGDTATSQAEAAYFVARLDVPGSFGRDGEHWRHSAVSGCAGRATAGPANADYEISDESLELEPGNDLRWYVTAVFASAIVFAGVVRILLIYVLARFNFGVGHELSSELYRRTLYQPYEAHISRNSSEIKAGVTKVDVVMDLSSYYP